MQVIEFCSVVFGSGGVIAQMYANQSYIAQLWVMLCYCRLKLAHFGQSPTRTAMEDCGSAVQLLGMALGMLCVLTNAALSCYRGGRSVLLVWGLVMP
jgi:hypothetical protein